MSSDRDNQNHCTKIIDSNVTKFGYNEHYYLFWSFHVNRNIMKVVK